MAGQKFFLTCPRAKVDMFQHIQRVFLTKKETKKTWGIAGQIKSFCGPHLARGPYVVHPWFKVTKRW